MPEKEISKEEAAYFLEQLNEYISFLTKGEKELNPEVLKEILAKFNPPT